MARRKFSQECKIEAVKLVRERGVRVAPAAQICLIDLAKEAISARP